MNISQVLHKQQLGKLGERIASVYLQKQGYIIVDTNFRARYGEIDIICLKDKVLVFVEVKTRIGREFGLPEESVTRKKIREIIQTAEFYALNHKTLPELWRIDVIGIELTSDEKVVYFNHIENVADS
jgi:putative endonuclease